MAEDQPMTDIHPHAPPPEVADPIAAWVYVAAVLALALVVAVVIWLRYLANRPVSPAPAADPRAAALNELHQLKERYAETPPDVFAARACGALRIVLADRFGEGSRSLTPDEFFARHREELATQFAPDRSAALGQLLATCDRMRFAPVPDTPSERLPLAEGAIAFVRELPEKACAELQTDEHPAAA